MATGTFVFDPYSAEMQQGDPFPTYAVLREEHPCWRDPEGRFWALSRYADVRECMTDHETFSSAAGIVLGQDTQQFPPMLSAIDPPQHTRMRKAAQPSFSPRNVAAMETKIRAGIRAILDGFGDRTRVDLVHDFVEPVPVLTIADLCGIPATDLPFFFDSLRGAIEKGLDSPEGRDGFGAIAEYFDRLVDERYANPAGDLTSAMAHATYEGELLSKWERTGLAMVMFIGGIEATTFHLGNACAQLGLFPDTQRELAADASLIPGAMEEVLRFDSSVQADLRHVQRDVELHGQQIPKGDMVMLLMGAANRDPAEFPDPDRFDIRRDPNNHVAFMLGIHFCIGAGLARLESRIVFEELFGRYAGYELVDAHVERTFTNRSVIRGVVSLPVALEPRA